MQKTENKDLEICLLFDNIFMLYWVVFIFCIGCVVGTGNGKFIFLIQGAYLKWTKTARKQ